ncbi:MAG: septum formation protein Maf [Candidatus Bipolaricaulota bacterium]|nr:MAG: septum formation protein Maf [Candidatus Bipolaricaulota bacterium]
MVLASSSPRRRQLLARYPVEVVVVPSDVVEVTAADPEGHVMANARAKAEAVAEKMTGLILGADTAVAHRGTVLGKPDSRDHARAMLERLSGTTHEVLTALHVLDSESGDARSAVERTEVTFRTLQPVDIERYLALEEYIGVAGAYAIQGVAGAFVERIKGDFYNVVGLPLCRLELLLSAFGVSLLAAG